MGLPGHRRTSSHKRRRASHFALKPTTVATDTTNNNQEHLPHRAAPGATSYRGHTIHVKGKEKKLEKLLKTKKPATKKDE